MGSRIKRKRSSDCLDDDGTEPDRYHVEIRWRLGDQDLPIYFSPPFATRSVAEWFLNQLHVISRALFLHDLFLQVVTCEITEWIRMGPSIEKRTSNKVLHSRTESKRPSVEI